MNDQLAQEHVQRQLGQLRAQGCKTFIARQGLDFFQSIDSTSDILWRRRIQSFKERLLDLTQLADFDPQDQILKGESEHFRRLLLCK